MIPEAPKKWTKCVTVYVKLGYLGFLPADISDVSTSKQKTLMVVICIRSECDPVKP